MHLIKITEASPKSDDWSATVNEEIEITQAMIEAVVMPFWRFNRERDLAEETVSEIFLAMWQARVRSD
jgi:hypothetical protein